MVVANGNEIHDQATEYDASGARIGNTANMVARVEYPYGNAAGQAKTAMLFAAADDLLAACEHLIKRIHCAQLIGGQERQMLTDAIAKAKGGA